MTKKIISVRIRIIMYLDLHSVALIKEPLLKAFVKHETCNLCAVRIVTANGDRDDINYYTQSFFKRG